MSQIIYTHIPQLQPMKKYPKEIYYKGDLSLLNKPIISIVGSRDPSQYTKAITYELASKLSKSGICIASGCAMGTDAIAHSGAGVNNTIAVMANGLDIRYPAVNQNLIASIEKYGLVLSTYKDGVGASKWSFVVRNEIVVALGMVLVVTQADINSGSMRSIEYAKAMGKPIYVLPHKIGESEGTNQLLQKNEAKAIYNVDEFVAGFGNIGKIDLQDELLVYCNNNPSYEEAVSIYGAKVYEYELSGKIQVQNGKIYLQ